MMRSSYNYENADIKVKINGIWQPATPQLRDIYIRYKSMPISRGQTTYSMDGITIFRTDNDPYMPTFYRWEGREDTETRRNDGYIFPESESNREREVIQEVTPNPIPIIDFNDIYVFLVDGVTGPGSRSGAGWVKARNYQAWAFVNFVYDTHIRKCYASRYSTYLAFPVGFDTHNVVTIDVDGLSPNIIFSVSRNDNNSVYYERNDTSRTRVRICDNELARVGFLGFYTRLTMDVGIIVAPPTNAYTILSPGSGLQCIGEIPSLIETTDEEQQCIMCYENKKNVQFQPCNHVISCYRCVQHMTKCECPVCKTGIHTINAYSSD
jgi:hypothetical protein